MCFVIVLCVCIILVCMYSLSLSLCLSFIICTHSLHFNSSYSLALTLCHPGCCCRDQLNDCYQYFNFRLSLIDILSAIIDYIAAAACCFSSLTFVCISCSFWSPTRLPVYRYSLLVTLYRYSLLVSLAVTPTTAAQRALSLAH